MTDPVVLYLTRDLMFASRVRPQLAERGLTYFIGRAWDDLLTKVAASLGEPAAGELAPGELASGELASGDSHSSASELGSDRPAAINVFPTVSRVILVLDLKTVDNLVGLPEMYSKLTVAFPNAVCMGLAYGPHVHVAHLEAARAAGFQEVWTQGQFDRGFSHWLSEQCG